MSRENTKINKQIILYMLFSINPFTMKKINIILILLLIAGLLSVLGCRVNPVNEAPVVDAGFLSGVVVGQTYFLSGGADDDGLPIPPGELVYVWSVVQGNSDAVNIFDDHSNESGVIFYEQGTYTLMLSVNDSEKVGIDTLEVSVGSGSDPGSNFPGWAKVDVGNHIASTVADQGVGSVEFVGSGYDIWGASDSFSYFYTNVSGNFTITGKITGMQTPWDENNPAYNWPKVGLMFRTELTDDAPYVFMGSTLSRLISQSRPTTGHQVRTSNTDTNHFAPIWLRLERVSDTFKAYYSVDGNNWVFYESYTLSSPSEIYVGLAVASKNDSITYTASFSDVSIQETSIEVCECSNWVDVSCGAGSCSDSQMQQTRSCSPAKCAVDVQCVASSSCSTPSGEKWQQIGPGAGGWYRAVRYNPTNPNEVLLSGDQAGMHKSYDGGHTWTFSTDGLYHYSVEDISVSEETVIIATMGGVYRSTDFGEHWEYVWEDITGPLRRESKQNQMGWIASVHISEANPNLMFAGSGGHHPVWNYPDIFNVYRSTDGGKHWTISNGGLTDSDMNDDSKKGVILHFSSDPKNENIVYMGTRKGFYKSIDAGLTWKKIRNKGSWYSVVDPKNSNIVYTLDFASSYIGTGQNVYKSTDGGQTWTQASNGIDPNANAEEIHFDPANKNNLYIGIRSKVIFYLYKSIDGGQSWEQIGADYNTPRGPSGSTQDIGVATSFDVYNGHIIKTPDMYLTEDDGENWVNVYTYEVKDNYWKGTGIEMQCVEEIVFDENTPGKMFMAVWDSGLWESVDYGDSWKTHYEIKKTYTIERVDSNGDPYRCFSARSAAIDKKDSNIIYVGMSGNLLRPDGEYSSLPGMITISRDGGKTWNEVPNLPERPATFMESYDNGNVFAFIEWNGLYKTTDKGNSWTHVSAGLPTNNRGVVAADPRNENTLYYGVAWQGLWKSTSGGNKGSWVEKSPNVITYPKDITVAPDGTVWVIQDGNNYGVWKSTDGAETFTRVFRLETDSEGYAANNLVYYEEIVVDPNEPETIYVAIREGYKNLMWNGVGVYVTRDGGNTWSFLADGMYHKNVVSMAIDESSGLLYAGVNCHGMYKYDTNN